MSLTDRETPHHSMSEDFWDTLKLVMLVLKPVLVPLSYCDGMKGVTVTLPYNLLLELDIYYTKPIKGLDESMLKKMHNVFMSRWITFHAERIYTITILYTLFTY